MKIFTLKNFILTLAILVSLFTISSINYKQAKSNSFDCQTCHDTSELTVILSNEDKGVHEWMQLKGEGLTISAPFTPSPNDYYLLNFPKRGRHSNIDLLDCTLCHLPLNGVEDHAKILYPDEGCTSDKGCHIWLKNNVTSVGFTNAEGNTAIYQGSMRAYDLLTQGDNAHSLIFTQGYRQESSVGDIAVRGINPGCKGCHNIIRSGHGEVPLCLDCHNFKERSHNIHISAINITVEFNDPKHADVDSCAYCHGFTPTDDNLYKPACYNCHLSGHQPLGNDGQAQFWPSKK